MHIPINKQLHLDVNRVAVKVMNRKGCMPVQLAKGESSTRDIQIYIICYMIAHLPTQRPVPCCTLKGPSI